ncbi:hypothetical protein SHKM778_84400 [Streptomyces sp. KM77-8]|uniref:Glycosyltransferase 2-like domain-containing protein n=1 Tax=Streptomyces haneummycinicus TaxID=3074435 RepID=A0AAT9HWI3_9ACTN
MTGAVRSALRQGPAVREVVAVDDGSTDGSAELLGRLAAREPRLRVIRCPVNSGGCGTPRNTGLAAVTSPYVMFLDSDDVLPPGAVDALLTAATRADAQVTGGLCAPRAAVGARGAVEPALYAAPAVHARPALRPRLVHDTLCVNKLYATDFLRAHGIRFPDGRFPYEDVVFTARVWAAAPRVALVPDRVYVWHVRRSARRLSISLDRAGIGNWRARTHACRTAHAILLDAGQKRLARRARAKFLDHELRMYARELPLRDEAYRREWWTHTRAFLAEYDAGDWARDPVAPGRLIGRVVLASPGRATFPGCGNWRPGRPGCARRTPARGTAHRAGRRSCPGSPWNPCRTGPRPCSRSPWTRNCVRARVACGCACTSCTGGWGGRDRCRWRSSGATGSATASWSATPWRCGPPPTAPGSRRRPSSSTGWPRSARAPGTCGCGCASGTVRAAGSPRTHSRGRACCAAARCRAPGTGWSWSGRTPPTRARWPCAWPPASTESCRCCTEDCGA